MRPSRLPAIVAVLIAATALATTPAVAVSRLPAMGEVQRGERGWNSPRALDLVRRAIERRSSWIGDADIRDYRALAEGHIYFLYDLGSGTTRHLVKADQLALQLYWATPGRTRQVVIGRREKKTLPTGIRYHLDHLTVVMDNFGDRISLGEGSEVRDVLHPAAAGAPSVYRYRVADSLTLSLPQREVRVYRVDVRPIDPSHAALVGALYLDRATADIVRMEFTFTAAAYRDDSIDYFNVRLENALWAGRYWLPHRQGIELRREFELLEFPAGGIIRAEFRIGDYEFDTGLDPQLLQGPAVSSVPRRMREAYEFEDELYDALDPATATAPPSMEEIRSEAARTVARSYLDQIEGLRPAVPGVSSVVRLRRGEGLYVGPGVAQRLPGGSSLLVLGGYAFGADRWQLSGGLRGPLAGALELEVEGYRDRSADVGVWPASSGAVATVAATVVGEDYREPYWASGGSLALVATLAGARARLSIGWEEWESAALEAADVVEREYRPVRSVDEGDAGFIALGWRRPAAAVEVVGGVTWEIRLEGASRSILGDFDYVQGKSRGSVMWPGALGDADVVVEGTVSATGGGRLPAQRLLPAGGRGTVRGYGFHRFAGNVYAGAGIEVRRQFIYPLLSAGLFGDVGWVGVEGERARRALAVWNEVGREAGGSRGPLVGVGGGVGLLFDIVYVEVGRGLRHGGIWELVVRVRREFWDWL